MGNKPSTSSRKSARSTSRQRKATPSPFRRKDAPAIEQPAQLFRTSKGAGIDALPLELWCDILDLLPREDVWRFRAVCRSWRPYIELHIAKTWFVNSRFLMIGVRREHVWLLEEPVGRTAHQQHSLAATCVGKDDRYLTFTLPEKIYSPPRPPRTRLNLEWDRYYRDLTSYPSWMQDLRQDRIPFVVNTPDYRRVENLLLLHTGARWRAKLGGKSQGYKVEPPCTLRVDWRVLYSTIFESAPDDRVRVVADATNSPAEATNPAAPH